VGPLGEIGKLCRIGRVDRVVLGGVGMVYRIDCVGRVRRLGR